MLFKSYYVVWKLFFHFALSSAIVLFKSYYVVWKHNMTKYGRIFDTMV